MTPRKEIPGGFRQTALKHSGGILVVNADDWGRDRLTTQRILECFARGAVSSVSAMVWMSDSERAAGLARERGIDAGLHLNFTTPFSACGCPPEVTKRQQEIARYLLWHRFSQVVFHPGLVRSFEYVVAAQLEEFRRIYGSEATRIDGHHHMHLCANVLLQKLLPAGVLVRRNFSSGEKERGLANRVYRRFVDRGLAERHRIADFFFSLTPLEPPHRLKRIFALAHEFAVELETHPFRPEEYDYLAGGKIFRQIGGARIAECSISSKSEHSETHRS